MKYFPFYLLVLAIIISSCKNLKDEDEEKKPIARVYDTKLYLDDIVDALPDENLSKDDSAALVRNLIDKWIKKHLILSKAEQFLTEEQKDVQRKLEDYRTSLLIFEYEQQLLEQDLDTSISKTEIEEYYNEYGSNFILGFDLVKAVLIKLPRESTNSYNIRIIYRSDMGLDELRNLCEQYGAIFEDFDRDWVKLGYVLEDIPYDVGDYERFLKYRRSIETKDTTYRYFFHVKEYYLRSSVAPIDYVDDNIRAILLNKRKAQYLRELESDIYEDAKNRGFFAIY